MTGETTYSFDVGRVETVRNQVCIVSGLTSPSLMSMVDLSSGVKGIVFGYTEQETQVVLIGDYLKVKRGDLVRPSGKSPAIPFSNALLGRIINAFGEPVDDRGEIEGGDPLLLDGLVRPIGERAFVDRPLNTGFLAVDAMIPVGLGQRELVLGEKKLGQTDLTASIIAHQAAIQSGVICILVTVAAQTATVKRQLDFLREHKAMENTVFVVGRASDSTPLNYLAPMAGVAIAEGFARQGKDVLIVFDNMNRHAKSYRELSLLLNRTPGREAYPGDIFYVHARLLERCGAFGKQVGGGSITALPIVETDSEDITDYITTNLMSITDGHILFSQTLANQGQVPPIDRGYSISRIGSRAQLPVAQELADRFKQLLIQYAELEKFSAFTTDVREETEEVLELGKRMTLCLNQHYGQVFSFHEEIFLMHLIVHKTILQWDVSQVSTVREQLYEFCKAHQDELSFLEAASKYEEVESEVDRWVAAFVEDPRTPKPLPKEVVSRAESETIVDILNSAGVSER